MKAKKIPIPIYNTEITVLNCTKEQLERYYSNVLDVDIDVSNGAAQAACIQLCGRILIWWDTPPTIPILAHEVCHAAFLVLNSRGVDPSDQEAFCYLVEYILKQLTCSK